MADCTFINCLNEINQIRIKFIFGVDELNVATASLIIILVEYSLTSSILLWMTSYYSGLFYTMLTGKIGSIKHNLFMSRALGAQKPGSK